MAPVARAFGAKAFAAPSVGAHRADANATEATPASAREPLSEHELFHLEILAQEDPSIDLPTEDNGADAQSTIFGADGLTFGDVLDIINPLQHIPVVSTLYRELTGDEISPGARMAGGALFGGPIGFAAATVNSVVEMATGSDIGKSVVAAINGDDDAPITAAAPGPIPTSDPSPVKVTAIAQPAVTQTLPSSLTGNQAPPTNNPPIVAKSAPGSLMNLYNSTTPAQTMTPTEALLQARAAVPLAGSVKGLGSSSRARFQPAGTSSPAPTPPPAPVTPTSTPNIGARLSKQLTLLAAQSQSAPGAHQSDKTAPAKNAPADNAGQTAPNPMAGTLAPTHPAPLPAAQIPTAMRDALDRYEQMKRQQLSPG
jgi:hypothetical protein